MDFFHEQALAEYRRFSENKATESRLWRTVAPGIGIGMFVLTSLLGQWNTDEYSGPSPAQRITTITVMVMIVGYFVRMHLLEKKQSRLWAALPEDARKIIISERKEKISRGDHDGL